MLKKVIINDIITVPEPSMFLVFQNVLGHFFVDF